MDILFIASGLVVAYLIGSIPTAIWFGKWYHGIDVRDHGSGNPGATNTFRVLGKRAGTVVLLVDIAKGLTASSIPVLLLGVDAIVVQDLVIFKLIYGIVAVVGHLFPIFLNFKGGKGVATLLGMMLAIHWEVAMLSVLLFVVILITTKYVSLGSILGVLSFPIMLLTIPRFKGGEPALILFGFLLFIVVVWTHHKNIKRIRNGEESKTYLFQRKSSTD